jgi:hypothetical protein
VFKRSENISSYRIVQEFSARALPFFFVGLLLGIFYPTINEKGRQAILSIISEHASPLTLDLLASYAVMAICLFTSIGGRTGVPIPKIRLLLGYYPAKAALEYASIFLGIVVGFTCGLAPYPAAGKFSWGGIMTMLYTVGILGLVVVASFKGRIVKDERLFRWVSVLLGLSLIVLFVKHYVI